MGYSIRLELHWTAQGSIQAAPTHQFQPAPRTPETLKRPPSTGLRVKSRTLYCFY
jgi:hypothetical protein